MGSSFSELGGAVSACLGGYRVWWESSAMDLGSVDFLGFPCVAVDLLRSMRFQF